MNIQEYLIKSANLYDFKLIKSWNPEKEEVGVRFS